MPSLVTERLTLRAFQPEDVDPLFEIQRDRDAMQYTFVAESRAASEAHLTAYAALYAEHGFAPWTVVWRADQRVIGWGGLNVDPLDSGWGIEVGYFVHRDYWGRGIASEIVRTSLAHGFGSLELSEIGAFTRPENTASVRVLEKAGFRFFAYEPRIERNRYALRREEWLA